MAFKFNPLTGNLDLVSASSGSTPTGIPNTFSYFDNAGLLASFNTWTVDPASLNVTASYTPSTGGNLLQLVPIVSALLAADIAGLSINPVINGQVQGTVRNINAYITGAGPADYVQATALYNEVPTLFDNTMVSVQNIGQVDGNFLGVNVYNQGNLAQGSMFNANNAAPITGDLFHYNSFNSGTVGGDFRHFVAGNNGDVAGFSSGVNIGDNNKITKGVDGFGYFHNGDIGDGSGINANLVSGNFNNGTIDGNACAVNFNSNATITGNVAMFQASTNGPSVGNGITGLNINNSADFTVGTQTMLGANIYNTGPGYRFSGFSAGNNANMSEEIRGLQFNSTGDARTGSGLEINMTGNFTDDTRGIRVNVSNMTSSSTSNHPQSAEFSGGTFTVQSDLTPFNNVGVDIGNGLSVTSTIASGSPLSGTDLILQLVQSNLLVNDDITTGPFGLDTNMLGFVSQIMVDTGKTAPLVRSALLGTTVPAGSGGTITEHVVLEILGLPSFGGAVSNPTRVAIQDSVLLGQNFSDGTVDSWFLRVRDPNVNNHLPRLAISTPSYKVTNGSVGIEIGGNSKALRVSNLSTADRDALTALPGMIVFNTDTLTLDFYTGVAWVPA